MWHKIHTRCFLCIKIYSQVYLKLTWNFNMSVLHNQRGNFPKLSRFSTKFPLFITIPPLLLSTKTLGNRGIFRLNVIFGDTPWLELNQTSEASYKLLTDIGVYFCTKLDFICHWKSMRRSSMHRQEYYSNRNSRQCSYGGPTIVLRHWKIVSLSCKEPRRNLTGLIWICERYRYLLSLCQTCPHFF